MDVVKPEAKNLHITCTFQLAKGSARQRYFTQDNVGVSKNIIDLLFPDHIYLGPTQILVCEELLFLHCFWR